MQAWEKQFLTFMHEQRSDVRNQLVKDKKLTDDLQKKLVAAITAFQPQFKA